MKVKAKKPMAFVKNQKITMYKVGDVFELEDELFEVNQRYVEVIEDEKEEEPEIETKSDIEVTEGEIPNIQELTVKQITEIVTGMDLDTIRTLYDQEKKGKARKTVLNMLEV